MEYFTQIANEIETTYCGETAEIIQDIINPYDWDYMIFLLCKSSISKYQTVTREKSIMLDPCIDLREDDRFISTEETLSDIISHIKNKLESGPVFMVLNMGDLLGHSFMLFRDHEYFIIDSYACERSCSVRPFDFVLFERMITDRSKDYWNTVFDCDELIGPYKSIPFEIHIISATGPEV